LLAVVTVALGRAALIDVVTVAIAATSVALLIYSRINSVWMIFAAGIAGLVLDRMVLAERDGFSGRPKRSAMRALTSSRIGIIGMDVGNEHRGRPGVPPCTINHGPLSGEAR
jgi:hypothetical protein